MKFRKTIDDLRTSVDRLTPVERDTIVLSIQLERILDNAVLIQRYSKRP